MRPYIGRGWLLLTAVTASGLACGVARAQVPSIRVEVEATQASRKQLHVRLELPVKPGELTLLYPKWIPGEHSPSGPVKDLTGLKMKAGGKPVPWRRDPEDMFTFHIQVPDGARTLE